MSLAKEIASHYPTLKRKMRIAHIDKTPEEYVAKNLSAAALIALVLTGAAFLFFKPLGAPLWGLALVFPLFFLVMFHVLVKLVDVEMRKLAKEIDKDVLFAGRFLLIKLNSGKPLINAIIDASNSYGVANKYFKEIVRDIELGTPLEEALEKASRYSPSEKMRRILFQISNALNIGVDVTDYLEAILDEIASDQLNEIQRYGKKLSGITMFYMLFAVVIPSLGITMFITIVSLISVPLDFGTLFLFLFVLVVIELAFITLFKQIRPTVNI